MSFTDQIRQALSSRVGKGKRFANNKRMADELEVDPSQLNRFLKRERGLTADSLGKILDRLGARIMFPDEPHEQSMEVVLSSEGALTPSSSDYIAVPITSPALAAQPGHIPEDAVEGWILAWRHHESIRFRTNLAATRIPQGDQSLAPLLTPGDIVLIDRNDKDPAPSGRIMLTSTPQGAASVRRVDARNTPAGLQLVFYTENTREYPPGTFMLESDYEGEISRAIGGSIVSSMADMTQK